MNNLKKVSIILLISLIFNIFYPIIANAADTGVEAQFEDPWLFHMIKDQPEFINAGYILESDSTTNKIKFSSKAINEGIKDLQNLDVGHKVKSLKGIEVFKNLETLNFPDNEIEDITPLQNLTKLKGIGLNGNKIKNIASLSKLTNLYQLVLDHNQIEDISALKNLTNLQEVNLGYNCISDVSPLDGKKMNNLYLNNQTVTGTITNEATGIKLPKIFQQALDPNSLGYMNIIEYNNQGTNCSTDSKGNTIKLTKDSEAIHTIKYQMNYKGPTDDKENEITKKGLHGSMFIVTVDRIPLRLEGEVERNKELTNQNVEATATFNKEVTIVSQKEENAWKIDPNNKKVAKRTYTNNINDSLIVKDAAGNQLPVTIEVTNIDKTAPSVASEKQVPANGGIKVTLTMSEAIQEVGNGWMLGTDKKTLTKTFTKNGTESVTFKDIAGNTGKTDVKITDVQAVALNVEITYDNTGITNGDVIATITSNKELQSKIKVGDGADGDCQNYGWTLSTDKKKLTKKYTANKTENITVYDTDGNKATKEVKITNIDKTAPTVTVQYIPNADRTSVQAILRVNEAIKDISGWQKIDNKYVKVYTGNCTETVEVYDLAGNKATQTITINQIKQTEDFDANLSYSTTEPTIGKVTATISSSKELQPLNGWTLSADKKKLTKDYDKNTNETVTVSDVNGNTKQIDIIISNINKATLNATVDYSTKDLTNKDVKVTIKADQRLKELDGWSFNADDTEISKLYSENVNNQKVTISDLAGNTKEVTITINNIDKTKPQVQVEYNPKDKEAEEVTVTIQANEQLREADGWTLSSDKKTLTKKYSKNTVEILTVYDLAGNGEDVSINVNNIKQNNNNQNNNNQNNNNQNGNNQNGNNQNNNNQNSGKEDPSTATGKLPNAGTSFIVIISIIVMSGVAIVLKKKLEEYKDIK